MITREELLQSSEYWIEVIQNKVFNDLIEYVESSNLSNKELAKMLGVSKGRVSQILSGENLNFRLDTLVKLCISINRIPDFRLLEINKYISMDKRSSYSIVFEGFDEKHASVDMQHYVPGEQSGMFKLKKEATIIVPKIKYNSRQSSSILEPKAA